jgi:hypothetical protein
MPLPALSDEALALWIRLLNTEIDLASAGEGGPIPLDWLEDRCVEAYGEKERREAMPLDLAS